jgi:hypothetical protein
MTEFHTAPEKLFPAFYGQHQEDWAQVQSVIDASIAWKNYIESLGAIHGISYVATSSGPFLGVLNVQPAQENPTSTYLGTTHRIF